MTDHETLEALIREIAERQKKEPEIPWFVHAREIVRTGQLIPAPSVDDLVERLPKEAAMLREIAQSYSRGIEWQANLSASAAMIDQSAARITALEASLAEAEGRVIAEVVAWLRKENGLCDCFARSGAECACGAWDDCKQRPLTQIAEEIEQGKYK